MSELTHALSKLSAIRMKDDQGDVASSFSIIVEYLIAEEFDRNSLVELLLEGGILDAALHVLHSREKFSDSTIVQVPRIIAELAKTEAGRKMCSDSYLVEQIVNLLESQSSEFVLQAARALGNICYDNEKARFLMKEKSRVGRVLKLFKAHLDQESVLKTLPRVTSGCLVNLLYTSEEIQDQALDDGILVVLLLYITKFYDDDEAVVHCITIVSCLADSEVGRKEILRSPLLPLLLKLFEGPISKVAMDSLLEAFSNLCEDDFAKLKLAEMGLCHKLLDLIRKHFNNEHSTKEKSHQIFKAAPDLVILMLIGDSSMEYLYEGGEGKVYKEILAWIKSENENLCIAGILALGNFARRDSHCVQMISSGVGEDLLYLLQKKSENWDEVRLQHAILSTMRNLAIPACNKVSLVELGIVDILLSMIDTETLPIIFKLLGTLRMILDKQEQVAIKVGGNVSFIKQLVVWSSNDDHPGVKGEATRILASLAKNSHSSSVMKKLIDNNALFHIVSLLKSEHVVMQNEALIAITLMAKCCTVDVEKEAETCKLCDAIINVLNRNSHIVEVTKNVLTLVSALMEAEKVRCWLKHTGLPGELKALKTSDKSILEERRKILLQMENAF